MALLLSDALAKANAADRAFSDLTEIKRSIQTSKNYSRDGTPPGEAAVLLLFSTSKQQTWLVSTTRRLYCVLDDLRNPSPTVNWSMDRSELVDENGKLRIQLAQRENTDRTGMVDIGSKHRGWLYSKSLFVSQPVDATIRELILKKMAA